MQRTLLQNTGLFLGIALFVGACSGSCGDIEPPPPPPIPKVNQAPIAHVTGPTEVIYGETVILTAAASSDPDDDELTFLWKEDAGNPVNNFLDDIALNEASITFVADAEGTFTFSVRVRDGEPLEDTASFSFTVTRSVENPVNFPPAVTGVIVNDLHFVGFGTSNRIIVYTSGTELVSMELLGEDPEDDLFQAHAEAPFLESGLITYQRSTTDVSRDTDGFHSVSAKVWLDDGEGGIPVKKTVEVHVVPRLDANTGKPLALYVDCSMPESGSGTLGSPYASIAEAYTTALGRPVDSRPDLYVAIGECQESIQVDFDGIAIYGLFDPETFRRRSGPADRVQDQETDGATRFFARTILSNPDNSAVLFTANPATQSGKLVLDGLSFDLQGSNLYGVAITTPANELYTLHVFGSEFVGTVTAAESTTYAPGGLLVRAAAPGDANTRIDLFRNYFSVAGFAAGSAFQAWVFHKGSTTVNAGRVRFYSNVFHGPIGATSGVFDNCQGSNSPTAFCFFSYSNAYVDVRKNLFWADSVTGTATLIPVVLSTGRGALIAHGNIFRATNIATRVRLMHAIDSTNYGYLVYNALPEPDPSLIFVRVTNQAYSSSADYTCIAGNGFALSSGACTTTSTGTSVYSIGSYYYASVSTAGTQPWRIGATEFIDAIPTSENTGTPTLDFDGRFAPVDSTSSGTAKHDTGPFEANAPMY